LFGADFKSEGKSLFGADFKSEGKSLFGADCKALFDFDGIEGKNVSWTNILSRLGLD
jgi:hypothetical protein